MCTIVRDVLAKMENTPYHVQYGAETLSVLLLACPTQLFGSLSAEVRDDLARVRTQFSLPSPSLLSLCSPLLLAILLIYCFLGSKFGRIHKRCTNRDSSNSRANVLSFEE